MSTTISGDSGVDKVQSGAVISDTSIKGALNATGTAPIYACRAWVNFNGTGTVAIRASGNVSSVTDNGVGDYTVNFTTAMPDADYATSISIPLSFSGYVSATTSSFRLNTGYPSGVAAVLVDQPYVCVSIFR